MNKDMVPGMVIRTVPYKLLVYLVYQVLRATMMLPWYQVPVAEYA